VEIGRESALVVALAGGVVVYERVLAEHGLRRFYSEALRRHGLTFELTEAAVRKLESEEHRAFKRVLRDVRTRLTEYAEQLTAEVQRSFAYITARHAGLTLREVKLTGEGAVLPTLADRMTGVLGATCSAVCAGQVVQTEGPMDEFAMDSALICALGLSLQGACEKGHWAQAATPAPVDPSEPMPAPSSVPEERAAA
jgi:Tfp pilus assembly PilM family ATPase